MPEVAYTLGNPESYDPAIAAARQRGERLYKLGRTEDYGGGIMFKTPEEARAHSIENDLGYEPYGVLLPQGWETNVDASRTQENYDCLLVDAEVFTLDEASETALKLLLPRIQAAGFVVSWHKVKTNTLLGGTSLDDDGTFKRYSNPFTVTHAPEGFLLRILWQLTLEERATREDEVLTLLKKHYRSCKNAEPSDSASLQHRVSRSGAPPTSPPPTPTR